MVDDQRQRLADEGRQRQRRWLRVLLLLSLAILLAVLAAELPEPVQQTSPGKTIQLGPDDQLIMAGERVGFLRLGLRIELVEERLGRGKAKPTQNAVLYRFDEAGLSCAVQNGHVISILISNPEFHTVKGLQIGSDADTVVRELGDHYEYEAVDRANLSSLTPPSPLPSPLPQTDLAYTLHYWREGIHLNLVQDRVNSLLVTAPAKDV